MLWAPLHDKAMSSQEHLYNVCVCVWAIVEASLECRYLQIAPDNYCYKRDKLLAAFVPTWGSWQQPDINS